METEFLLRNADYGNTADCGDFRSSSAICNLQLALSSLLLLRSRRARRRDRHFAEPAQRASQHRLSFGEVKFLTTTRHFLLELFVVQHDDLPNVDHHVVDRTMA